MVSKRKNETDEQFKTRKKRIDAEYRAANRDRIRLYTKAWREENKQRKSRSDAEWRAANPERMKEARDAWKARNKTRLVAYKHRRRARSTGGTLSADIIDRLMKLQRGRCANCASRLNGVKHLDHVMPLALGGKNDDSNIQLLCPPCNLRKNAKHPLNFAAEEGRLL